MECKTCRALPVPHPACRHAIFRKPENRDVAMAQIVTLYNSKEQDKALDELFGRK